MILNYYSGNGVLLSIAVVVSFFLYVILSIFSTPTLNKLIIYMYLEEETEISVKLGNEKNLICV